MPTFQIKAASNPITEEYLCLCEIDQRLKRQEAFKISLFYDLTRDSIANNFVIDVYCRCLEILRQIA